MTDIVERLRGKFLVASVDDSLDPLLQEAADEIARLRIEVRHLRETVQEWQRREVDAPDREDGGQYAGSRYRKPRTSQAAAEVQRPLRELKAASDAKLYGTAAAEVADDNDNIDRLHAENMDLRIKLNATIERCAQVADNYQFVLVYPNTVIPPDKEGIAAAIRALNHK